MTPDIPPPDDERGPDSNDANVVDPEVLAERRAQRAEHSERSATRRAADAQSLAADLARERARLEAERDAARAEAAAAREGADAVKAEARHLQAERDALRVEVERGEAEREALRAEIEQVRVEHAGSPTAEADVAAAPAADAEPQGEAPDGTDDEPSEDASPSNGNGNRDRSGLPANWGEGLRHELAVARAAAERPASAGVPPATAESSAMAALERERELVARKAAEEPRVPPAAAKPADGDEAATAVRPTDSDEAVTSVPPAPARPARSERATPLTELALERERSGRLRTELERAAAIERELRAQLAGLEHAVVERRDAERRIETALRRMRREFDAARELAAVDASDASASASASADADADASSASASAGAPAGLGSGQASTGPAPAGGSPELAGRSAAAGMPAVVRSPSLPQLPEALASSPAPTAVASSGLDAGRLDAAQARLRAAAPSELGEAQLPAAPSGPPAPWIPTALRRLMRDDPRTVGRLIAAMLPAQGLVTQRALRYDVVLAGRGCIGVDVGDDGTTVRHHEQPRSRRDVDFRLTADEEGLARLLLARRGRRRGARVRGSRRRVRELRRLVQDPLALRDLASAGAMLDPVLAFALVALAVDPAATFGHRFTIAHAPLAGGPADAWLRIQNGGPVAVLRARPGETPAVTIRSTRGALLPLLAGIEPPRGEAAAIDGDPAAIAILRAWIARTEFPSA